MSLGHRLRGAQLLILEPVEEVYPKAIKESSAFAKSNQLSFLSTWLAGAKDEEAFCEAYYDHYDEACAVPKPLYQPS